ncbi:MAG: DUF3048 domain-containing protein [Bacilli bacterium]|nr:DUF3048 domain-containing protein [Bacilli bacterium]
MRFDIEEEPRQKRKKSDNDTPSNLTIIAVFLVIAAIILIVTYMFLKSGNTSGRTPQVEVTTPTPSTSATPTPTPEEEKLTIVDEESDERPIAVVIDNAIGDARHAGLLESYINYEIPIEGGATRILAVFKDVDAKLIGPINGAKNYFIDYALESDSILVYYGSSSDKKDEEVKIDIVNGLTDSDPFRRDTKSVAPHNVFTRMTYLNSFLQTSKYNLETLDWQLLNYSVEEVDLSESGYVPKKAVKIELPYSDTEKRVYNYDEENDYYLRSSNGHDQFDRKSGKQLHYKNIIIEKVPTKTTDGVFRVETTGKGKAYIITGGKYLPITWSKESRDAKTIYTYENGTEVTLNDGNTFIQILPENCILTIN